MLKSIDYLSFLIISIFYESSIITPCKSQYRSYSIEIKCFKTKILLLPNMQDFTKNYSASQSCIIIITCAENRLDPFF